MENKFFITTPIYYVNDLPHIGSAYPTIAADVLARFHKQIGDKTFFLTGTDEHGAKIVQAAASHNQNPKEYADKISEEFKKAWKILNINYSRFIRTTDEDHIKTAQDLLQKLYDNSYIGPKPRMYKGFYCIGHEKFMLPNELVNGICPDHKTKPVEHSEKNYYFKLSEFGEPLIKLIESDELKIRPQSRRNETLSRLRHGLEDISISRATLPWGIPLPFDPKHTSYVWIEALINYYTYGKPLGIWPADLHIVGKDILWFHAIVWPAMLLAIKEEPPKEIFVHGFFTISGQKMSKTIGNVIAPSDLVKRFGADGTRYLMLTAFTFGDDGDVSWDKFTEKYNADLANGLGNLIARVAKLCEKVTLSKSPTPFFSEEYIKDLKNCEFNDVLENVWNEIRILDRQINSQEPWKITDNKKLAQVLQFAVDRIIAIVHELKSFLPETAGKIEEQFKGPKIKSQKPLFPRI